MKTTTDLVDGTSWVGVPGYVTITGAGQTVTATLPFSAGARFYRLKVRLAP